MKLLCTSVFILFLGISLSAQSTTVQTFNFNSTTRDTLVSFPTGDHNDYKKIIMHYTMRCKDALVSTGTDRNRGCGEWDYSCNTYIVDSTRVDSVKANSPEYAMPGFEGTQFSYTDQPSYNFYSFEHKDVTLVDSEDTESYVPAEATEAFDDDFANDLSGKKFYYILTDEWLTSNGVSQIAAMKWPVEDQVSYKNLEISMASTSSDLVADALLEAKDNWTKLCFDDITLSPANDTVYFHDDFEGWEAGSNIIVSISFDSVEGSHPTRGFNLDAGKTLVCSDLQEQYLRVASSGLLVVEGGLPEVSNEISISFWSRGDGRLPVNTSLLEAVDESGNRQINIHLPWANGQIYWDCGNDGNGYDRINKPAADQLYKNEWTHWTFTKNASTGIMNIFVNGELWHTGSAKTKPIQAYALNIASNIAETVSYYGDLDELCIFNKALDDNEIRTLMYNSVTPAHPEYESLVLYYKFNNSDGETVIDESSYSHNARKEGFVGFVDWRARDLFLDGRSNNLIPEHTLISGNFVFSISNSTIIDSLPVLPQLVNHYRVDGTDLVLEWSDYFYAAGEYPITNESGAQTGTRNYPEAGVFEEGELLYYNKSPMAYEIMSFVTPYGIGLDMGESGYSWSFDVTDFGPVLKGDKRIYMSRGGQWQEEMDIRFEFIEGIPDRDVIDIQQIWRVDQVPYGNIINDWRFEPRQFTYDPSVAQYVIRTAVTGHGQEGEFIPRNHSIDVDGFIDTWAVWKECAENPVYPQGGTWVYDRAGWCPGMATDVRRYDVTPYFQFSQTPLVDYSVQTASGDSRYIVNSQLLKYGPANKQSDIALSDLVHPSNSIVHGRYNPSCHAPRVIIENKGQQIANSATLYYGIQGKWEQSYSWNGVLPFLGKQEVILPYDPLLALAESGDTFYVRIESGAGDEDAFNNELQTILNIPDHYTNDVVIEWRTNFTPQETSYRVTDESGELILFKSGSVLNNNTTYRDTLKSLNGCYKILISDNDNDGISWWANNDGNGYIRVKEIGGPWKEIATDFGAFIDYNFTAGMISSVQSEHIASPVLLYPNPSSGDIFLEGLDNWESTISITVYSTTGQLVYSGYVSRDEINRRPVSMLSSLHQGSYTIHLTDGNRLSINKFVRL